MSDNKLDDVDDNNDTSIIDNVNIPILPLRDVVVFPNMVIPLFVGREKSIVALDHAMKKDKKILLLTQKTADIVDSVPIVNKSLMLGSSISAVF